MATATPRRKPVWKRWWMFVVYALVVLGVIGSVLPSDKKKPKPAPASVTGGAVTTVQDAATQTTAVPASTEEPVVAAAEATTPEAPADPPAPADPKAIKLRGSGSKVVTVKLSEDAPAIIKLTNGGGGNFAIWFRQSGEDLVVNEIGRYAGTVVAKDAVSGKAKLEVDSDGPWTAVVTQPVALPTRDLPAQLHGKGSQVYRVLSNDSEWTVTATHRGSSNFAVYLVGYGDTSGASLLFNEIGHFSGETVADTGDATAMLVVVEADGAWTLKFAE